jgi:hypothetical protein
MREITSFLAAKKMIKEKKKLREQGSLKGRLQAEVINLKGKPWRENKLG